MKILNKYLLLTCILFVGIIFRFTGLNWDNNQHLHPDERFLTMVTQAIKWPASLPEYFDTGESPLNPRNTGYPFFVYGTFPLFLVKGVSQLVGMSDYNGITLVGRFISGVLDLLVIYFVYLSALLIFKSRKAGILSALIYSASVLPIQLSHYYTVDTFMNLLLFLAFYILLKMFLVSVFRTRLIYSAVLGLFLGLAVASKITGLLFFPVIFLVYIFDFIKNRDFKILLLPGVIFLLTFFLSLRVSQPYMFSGPVTISQDFIDNLKQLKSFDNPDGNYPPSVQWITSKPLLFPLENIFYWGWGPVMAVIILLSVIFSLKNIKSYPLVAVPLIWVIGLFIYQGLQFTKPLRYFYPIFPFAAIPAGFTLEKIWVFIKNRLIRIILIILILFWPVSFMSVYTRSNTRVQATDWILKNIPVGSTISCEYWDDCLPLGYNNSYKTVEFHLYDPESIRKWTDILAGLSRVDYLILSSNRLYGSIMTVPDKYPETTRFYNDLFSGKLGFEPIAQFTSRPDLPLPGFKFCLTPPFINYGKVAADIQTCDQPGLNFVDDYADETFTVYDHPKVIIFKKI